MRTRILLIAVMGVIAPAFASAPASARPVESFIPPVDGPIDERFDPPETRYGPGHRGIDYVVPSGTRVRAAGSGTVYFAGSVAGNLAVTIDHGNGLHSTYSILERIEVETGEAVDQGRFIGAAGRAHPGESSGLHFGVKLHGEYVDPLDYLGATDVSRAIHLAPLVDSLETELPQEPALAFDGAGSHVRSCRPQRDLSGRPPAPSDNVAVSVAGIGSRTAGEPNATIYEAGNGPQRLGYSPARTYKFSYRSTHGRRLHERYESRDTFGDIKNAAARLRRLLVEIAKRHPGRSVDLFAHSQGGLVARVMLAHMADSFDSRLPRVEHLVTYGAPHEGAPLAGEARELERTVTGPFVLDRLAELGGGRVPDARSVAVHQLAPGSSLLRRVAAEDVTFGTRVLALAMPHDVVVPATSARYAGETSRVLSPRGLNGHDTVVSSDQARALSYAFLRDAPASCPAAWDEVGLLTGGAIARLEDGLSVAYRAAEGAVLGRVRAAIGVLRRGFSGTARASAEAAATTARRIAKPLGSGADMVGAAGRWVLENTVPGGRLVRWVLESPWWEPARP
jgi:hypothetical protein